MNFLIFSQDEDGEFQYQTLRRRRKFKFEGKEVTTETTQIIQVSEDQKQQKTLQDSKKYQQMRQEHTCTHHMHVCPRENHTPSHVCLLVARTWLITCNCPRENHTPSDTLIN